MFAKQQELMVRVMNLFAEQFDKHAVLRGGMVLCVLGCDRLTNDLDYIFIPYTSKRDIVAAVIKTLSAIKGANIEHSLNSKCLRVILTVDGVSVQIESKVAVHVPTQILSTKELAGKYGLPPRLIAVLDYPAALAHKMAAWNERRLFRDAYDIWFYLKLGVRPDTEILKSRLRKSSYSKLVSPAEYFIGDEVQAFYDFLFAYACRWTDRQIVDSLGNYIEKDALAGISMKFRSEFMKLTDQAGAQTSAPQKALFLNELSVRQKKLNTDGSTPKSRTRNV